MELIKVTEKEGQSVVSARDLYDFLEVGRDFSTWCKQMIDYGFVDGLDFTPFSGESTGGRPSIDYALTIETAKHWAMMQRSEKGMQARNYFLNCEKKLKSGMFQIPVSTVVYNLGRPISINDKGYWNMIEMCAIYGKSMKSWDGSSAALAVYTEMKINGEPDSEIIYSDDCGTWCHPSVVPLFSNWVNPNLAVFCNKYLNPSYKEVEVREYCRLTRYKSVCQYFLENRMANPMTKKELYVDYMRWCGDGDSLMAMEFDYYIKNLDLGVFGDLGQKKLFPKSRKNEVLWKY